MLDDVELLFGLYYYRYIGNTNLYMQFECDSSNAHEGQTRIVSRIERETGVTITHGRSELHQFTLTMDMYMISKADH